MSLESTEVYWLSTHPALAGAKYKNVPTPRVTMECAGVSKTYWIIKNPRHQWHIGTCLNTTKPQTCDIHDIWISMKFWWIWCWLLPHVQNTQQKAGHWLVFTFNSNSIASIPCSVWLYISYHCVTGHIYTVYVMLLLLWQVYQYSSVSNIHQVSMSNVDYSIIVLKR